VTDRLASALAELHDTWPDAEEIVRADVSGDGAIVLTAAGTGVTRWFTWDDRGLIERFPVDDRKVPLSRYLAGRDDWSVLSYRPGRRMVVVQCREELASIVKGNVVKGNVVKGYKKGRSARAAVHQRLAEAAMARGAFCVPRLLRHAADNEALVFERFEGPEVGLGLDSEPLYARLGETLAAFQENECSGQIAVFTWKDELEVLERWAEKVRAAVGALPEGWTATHARLVEQARDLPEPRMGLAHRDLHDRQVHLVAGDVTLLDFDLMCCADVALDPGNLVAHLRWRALLGLHGADDESCRALERAFLDAHGRSSEAGFATRLAFYTAGAFLRLALVYRLRPRWSGRVPELVLMAGAVLDDLPSPR
jgi:hypothetical protein